jgi:hypothetical protein
MAVGEAPDVGEGDGLQVDGVELGERVDAISAERDQAC